MSRLGPQELEQRALALAGLMSGCQLCPRRCGVDRAAERGFCGQPDTARVAWSGPHRGEEPAFTRGAGAGTLFLEGCTMRCAFCQNHQISHALSSPGRALQAAELAGLMLDLERRGCANIEWVTPTSHLPSLVRALARARRDGLTLPLVYNSSGYERVEVLRLLDGVVDIYMPDCKYSDPALGLSLSQTPDYVPVNRQALGEMWRQAGPLRLDDEGRAVAGLLVRHMMLPGMLENTRGVLQWLAETLGRGVWVSVMSQYAPLWVTPERERPASLGRRITRREQKMVLGMLADLGLEHGWAQDRASWIDFLPDFARQMPFSPEPEGPPALPGER